MPKREAKVQVRITTDLRLRLDRAVGKTGVPEPVIVARCLEACCDYVEKEGAITFPLIVRPGGDEPSLSHVAAAVAVVGQNGKTSAKAKRAQLRDIREVSLPIFGTIPAGWPADGQSAPPKRTVKVPKGKYPSNAFGLDVKGNSMNNPIRSKFGPILNGDTLVLVPFETESKAKGQIVAALSDGGTTLKRFEGMSDGKPVLSSETDDPSAARRIVPEHDLKIQGVVIDKLQRQGVEEKF